MAIFNEDASSPGSVHKNTIDEDAASHRTDFDIVEEELRKIVNTVEETEKKRAAKAERMKNRHVHIQIQEANKEIKDMTIENKVLQKRLFAIQKRRSTIGTKLFLEGADTQYQIALKQWMDAKEELERVMDEYNNKVDRMQERVRDKQQEAHELYKEFSEYKWQVAKEARHVLSGRKLSSTLLDEYKSKDAEADMDIERLRIEGRQLASQLKKTQQAILKKDQLSENLFAVDFEQLKIESEALNEKVFRKNKELSDLGKKTTHVVHVLSHSRERLKFVEKKIQDDKAKLGALEGEICKARVELQQIKMACENLRSKRERIQTNMNVQALPLLDDMEAYRAEGKVAQKRLKALKHEYEALVDDIHNMQKAIQDHSSSCFINSCLSDSTPKSLRWGASSNINIKRPMVGT